MGKKYDFFFVTVVYSEVYSETKSIVKSIAANFDSPPFR